VAVFFDDISEYRDRFQQVLRHFTLKNSKGFPSQLTLERNTAFVNCYFFHV